MVPTVHSCEHRLEAGIWILQRNPYHVRLVNYQSLPVSTTYRISFFGMKHLCKHVINRSMLFGTKPPERSETTGRSEWHGNSLSPVNSTQTQRLLLAGSTCFPYMSWWRSLERALLFFFFSSILNQIFKVWPEHLVKSSLRTRLGKKHVALIVAHQGKLCRVKYQPNHPLKPLWNQLYALMSLRRSSFRTLRFELRYTDREPKECIFFYSYYFCLVGSREIGSPRDFLQARLHANNRPQVGVKINILKYNNVR